MGNGYHKATEEEILQMMEAQAAADMPDYLDNLQEEDRLKFQLLTKKERQELNTAWNNKWIAMRDELPDAQEKSSTFSDLLKEYTTKSNMLYKEQATPEKMKRHARQIIKAKQYRLFTAFWGTQIVRHIVADGELKPEGKYLEGVDITEKMSEEEKARINDLEKMAAFYIGFIIREQTELFLQKSDKDAAEALAEWKAFLEPLRKKKIDEWKKEQEEPQATEQGTAAEPRKKEAGDVPRTLEAFIKLANATKTNLTLQKHATLMNSIISNKLDFCNSELLKLSPDGQTVMFPATDGSEENIIPIPVYEQTLPTYRNYKKLTDVINWASMSADTPDAKLPKEYKDIELFDEDVLNMTLSIYWNNGKGYKEFIKLDDIYNALEGTLDNPKRLKAEMRQALARSLFKFYYRLLFYNFKEEITAGLLEAAETDDAEIKALKKKGITQDKILNFKPFYIDDKTPNTREDRERNLYGIYISKNDVPFLLMYARMKGSFLTFRFDVLNIREVSGTKENIAIKLYLVKLIELQKKQKAKDRDAKQKAAKRNGEKPPKPTPYTFKIDLLKMLDEVYNKRSKAEKARPDYEKPIDFKSGAGRNKKFRKLCDIAKMMKHWRDTKYIVDCDLLKMGKGHESTTISVTI